MAGVPVHCSGLDSGKRRPARGHIERSAVGAEIEEVVLRSGLWRISTSARRSGASSRGVSFSCVIGDGAFDGIRLRRDKAFAAMPGGNGHEKRKCQASRWWSPRRTGTCRETVEAGARMDSDGRNINEVIRMANDRRFGLLWTRIECVWNPDIYARENSLRKSRGLQNGSGL